MSYPLYISKRRQKDTTTLRAFCNTHTVYSFTKNSRAEILGSDKTEFETKYIL